MKNSCARDQAQSFILHSAICPALHRPPHVEPDEILPVLIEDFLGLEQLPGPLLLRREGAISPFHPAELLPARPATQPVVFLSLEKARKGEGRKKNDRYTDQNVQGVEGGRGCGPSPRTR